MFEINEAYSKGPNGDDLMVIDEERDVWLQCVSGLRRRSRTVFKLVWGKRVIPFEVRAEPKFDENGKEYIVKQFQTFGASLTAEQNGVKRYEFEDPEERRQAQFLAVEAVLAFGGHYDGIKHPDGHHKFEFERRLYTKSDFGLP